MIEHKKVPSIQFGLPATGTVTAARLASGVAQAAFADDTHLNGGVVTKLPEVQVKEPSGKTPVAPKFSTPLLDTPQTITVIPKQIIEQQAATNLRDILRNSPGITFQAGEGGTPAGDQMTIRGFSARTDMFVDGVRDLGGHARDSFNLEQVEVAKKPSSSTAGRGSTGGSVNLVTKTPQSVASRNITAAIGTDDHRRATADINQPIGEDKAVRLNLMVLPMSGSFRSRTPVCPDATSWKTSAGASLHRWPSVSAGRRRSFSRGNGSSRKTFQTTACRGRFMITIRPCPPRTGMA